MSESDKNLNTSYEGSNTNIEEKNTSSKQSIESIAISTENIKTKKHSFFASKGAKTFTIFGIVAILIGAIAFITLRNTNEFGAQTANTTRNIIYDPTAKRLLANSASSGLCLSIPSGNIVRGTTASFQPCSSTDTKQAFAVTNPPTNSNVVMKGSKWSPNLISFINKTKGKENIDLCFCNPNNAYNIVKMWNQEINVLHFYKSINEPFYTNPKLLAAKSDKEILSDYILTQNNAKYTRISQAKDIVSGDIIIINEGNVLSYWAIATGNHRGGNEIEIYTQGVPLSKNANNFYKNYSSFVVGFRGE